MQVSSISWLWAPLIIGLAVAVICDLRSRRIPNLLSVALAAAGFVMMTWVSGWSGAGNALAGLAVGLLALLPLYALGGMGAGDVKLMAACGAWLGWKLALVAVVVTYLAGGVLAVVVVGWTLVTKTGLSLGSIASFTLSSPRALLRTVSGTTFPYALAIASGCIYAIATAA